MKKLLVAAAAAAVVGLGAYTATRESESAPAVHPVSDDSLYSAYVEWISQHWTQAWLRAQQLRVASGSFLARPDADGLESLRQQWREAQRAVMLALPTARLTGDEVRQRRLAAWPVDEGLIDYVSMDRYIHHPGNTMATANYVRNEAVFVPSSVQRMKPLVGKYVRQLADHGSDPGHAPAGLHALEFLLWGQQGERGEAGRRPLSDFSRDDESCTTDTRAAAGKRLRECLRRLQAVQAIADAYSEDLSEIVLAMENDAESLFAPLKPGSGMVAHELLRLLQSATQRIADRSLAVTELQFMPNEFSGEIARYVGLQIDAIDGIWQLRPADDASGAEQAAPVRDSLRNWTIARDRAAAAAVDEALMALRMAHAEQAESSPVAWLADGHAAQALRPHLQQLLTAFDRLVEMADPHFSRGASARRSGRAPGLSS